MQLKILMAERVMELEDMVNRFLEGRPNSEIINQEIHFPPNPGDPCVAVIWIRSTKRLKEGESK